MIIEITELQAIGLTAVIRMWDREHRDNVTAIAVAVRKVEKMITIEWEKENSGVWLGEER